MEDRACASYSPQPPQGGGDGGRENEPESSGDRLEDPNVNNARPVVGATGKSDRGETLAKAFEKAKTNGHARPIK
jgi:hypothetical protein